MLKVEDGKIELHGTLEEMLMDGIMAVKAIADTNELLQKNEMKEQYLKDIREMMYKDVNIVKFGRTYIEKSKENFRKEKKSGLEERRNFRNGNYSN